jgi:hypothetical protein
MLGLRMAVVIDHSFLFALLFHTPTVAEMALLPIQHPAQQATPEDMERMLTELEALSDESARKLRAEIRQARNSVAWCSTIALNNPRLST